MIRLLTENLGWKLLSLLIAVGLWLAIVGEPELTTTLSAPLELMNIPKDLEISSDVPERLRLEVSGPSGKVSAIRLAETAAVVDLSPVHQAGERTFTIGPANLSLPSGVSLSRAIPSQIRLIFESRLSREVPVQIHYAGPPAAGYRILRQEVRPEKLPVVGPETRVLRTEYVETDAIDLTPVISEASFNVHAYVADPHVRFESPNTVHVKVVLEKISK